MNKKILLVTIIIVIIGFLFYNHKPIENTQIEYKNTEYDFTFSLPLNWHGYTVLNKTWEGILLDGTNSEKIIGPEIFIRNPLWTSANPYQDIPIMIFTPSQWDLIQKETLSVSAAPIGPTEIGRNSQYIFALPARYNFAYPTGFEEVVRIIDSKPLHF